MTWRSITSYAPAWMTINSHISEHLQQFIVKDTHEVINGIKTRVIYFNIPPEVKEFIINYKLPNPVLPDSEVAKNVYKTIIKYFKTKNPTDILEDDYNDLINYIITETGMQKHQVELALLKLAKEKLIEIEDLGLTKIVRLNKSRGLDALLDLVFDILKKYGKPKFMKSNYNPPYLLFYGSFTGDEEKSLKYIISINTQDNTGNLTLKLEDAEIRIPFILPTDYPLELLPLPKKYFEKV